MGLTATQKIVASHAGRDSVEVGETVTVKVDLAMSNDMTWPLAVKQFRAAGATRVFDPDRICIVAGRHMPFRDEAFAKSVGGVGEWCREQGIKNFFANMEGWTTRWCRISASSGRACWFATPTPTPAPTARWERGGCRWARPTWLISMRSARPGCGCRKSIRVRYTGNQANT